jgi:hypothetical protein
MVSKSRLVFDFARRVIDDLATNNVLRGSWAEQVVAFYLGLESWPGNWCYYDLRDADGREISVKHSVGPRPSFGVAMSKWAWDPDLARDDPVTEGWRGGDTQAPQYWCHAYVFAWLDTPNAAPDLDDVLDPERWTFWILSRGEMHRAFGIAEQKNVGRQRIISLKGEPIGGRELAELVRAIPLAERGVPPRRFDPWRKGQVGPPVLPTTDVVPSSVEEAAKAQLPFT